MLKYVLSLEKAVVHLDSQQLWQHLQDLCKLKPDKNSFMKDKGGHESLLLAVELLATEGSWKKVAYFI